MFSIYNSILGSFLLLISIFALFACRNPFDLPVEEKKSDRDNSRFTTETQHLVAASLILSSLSEAHIVNLNNSDASRKIARFSFSHQPGQPYPRVELEVSSKEQMIYAFFYTWDIVDSPTSSILAPKIEKIDLSSLFIDDIHIVRNIPADDSNFHGGLQVHSTKEKLFWFEVFKDGELYVSHIRSSDLERQNINTLFIVRETLRDLAIDESSEILYWMTDTGIFSSDLLGEDRNKIFTGAINNAKEFKFDFEKGWVYWTEKLGRYEIRGANITDNNERVTLLTSNHPIYSFTLDWVNDKLYYYGSADTIFGNSSTYSIRPALRVIDLKTLENEKTGYAAFMILDMNILYSRKGI